MQQGDVRCNFRVAAFVCALVNMAVFASPVQAQFTPPSGTYRTSWVGNTFSGIGGPNGFGDWVQNGIDKVRVTPDGTVIAGVPWDENGRCVGLYKEGKPNHILLQERRADHKETAWGFGTANNALAVFGDTIYVGNTGKQLLRFHWTPGDINSAKFVDETQMPDLMFSLAVNAKHVAIVYKTGIELRAADSLAVVKKINVSGARDVAFAADGSLWTLADNKISQASAKTNWTPAPVAIKLDQPSALSFDNKGRLIVCENGAAQQVLFYDVAGAPKLVSTFGQSGGLCAGVPGQVKPDKLFALRGAGTDAQGNLYVGMSFDPGPNGNTYIRSFAPTGNLRWEVYSNAFVDTFGFEPGTDGKSVYSRTGIFDLDLDGAKPGQEATLRAITLDPVHYPKDLRIHEGCTALPRILQGKRVLFTAAQYAGGYHIYTYENEKSSLAHEVDKIGGPEQWAWDLTEGGDIWHGDAPNRTIRRYKFGGWTADGKPIYDWQNPQTWPWPEGWDIIRRVKYEPKGDTLYITGYLTGQKAESWGVAGATARRYDGWLSGKPTVRWTAPLPHDDTPDPQTGFLTPEGVDIAGDYMFLGMVKPTKGREVVNIIRLADGKPAGTFVPGPELGDLQGWLDMPYSVQAIKRKNGEYLILVEEDARAKNILYRWRPEEPGKTAAQR